MEDLYPRELPSKIWVDRNAVAKVGEKRKTVDDDSDEEPESEAETGSEVTGKEDGQGAESGTGK